MRKLLIPFVAIFVCMATLVHAQLPKGISLPTGFKFTENPVSSAQHADMPCNFAGTFAPGAFTGQSNDLFTTPLINDTLFLCLGDQMLLDHNGNGVLSGDPVAGTTPGIGWAFYDCPPTILGDNLQSVLADPCVWPNGPNGLWVATDQVSGDIVLQNGGQLQNSVLFNPNPNTGKPVVVYLAPITLDNFATQGFEATIGQPGPCVNVNTSQAFPVAYLNAIQITNINTNAQNDCIGRFRLEGGYPEINSAALYTVDISLVGSPNVKAIVQTPPNQLTYFAQVTFYVPQSGTYNVVISDGKSCGFVGTVNMTACAPADNLILSSPDVVAPPGTFFCVPVTAQNFNNIVAGSFSLNWDESVIQFVGLTDTNQLLNMLSPVNGSTTSLTLNETQTSNGFLGGVFFNSLGFPINIPANDTLFQLCFDVVGPLNSCTGLTLTSDPTQINFETPNGPIGLTDNLGNICVNFAPLSFILTVTDSTCLGTGTLMVEPVGGIYPIDVVVKKLPSGPNFNGVLLGSPDKFTVLGVGDPNNIPVDYCICLTDQNGNGVTVCDTITVLIPNLGAQIEFTQTPLCNGGSEGILTAIVLEGGVAVSNPGPQYTYMWSPSTVPDPDGRVQNGVEAGFYGVTITDTNKNCSFSASGTLGQPAAISDDNISLTPASCSGVCNGIINYLAEGGTTLTGGDYRYTWTYAPDDVSPISSGPSLVIDNPLLLNNACAGFYRITITDQNGCTFIDSLAIANAMDVVLSGTAFKTQCAGDSTGLIDVAVAVVPANPGNGFTFFWTPIPPTFVVNDTPTSSTYSGLPAGTYSVLARDAAGCQDTMSFVVTSPPVFVLDTINFKGPDCANLTGGSIAVTATGGTNSGPASINYTWNTTPVQVGSNLNNLMAGTYIVTASDLNGCTDTASFNLLPPPPLVITSIDSVSVKCGSDGCLKVNAPVADEFLWSTLNGNIIDTTQQVCNLPGGTYVILIRDVLGCEARDTVTLGGVLSISISDTTLIMPTCNGLTDGTIGITVVGGNGGYTFNWTPNPTTLSGSTITPIGAGNYEVVITDSEGCKVADTLTLTQPPAIAVTLPTGQPKKTSCAETCDGAATLLVEYDNGVKGNFTFQWDDNNSVDSVRTDLCPGPHSVIVRDANNCFTTFDLDIDAPDSVGATFMKMDVRCFGGNDGSLTVFGQGGNGAPFTYQWSNGGTTGTIGPLSVSDSPNGLFSVTVTDKGGCSKTFPIQLDEPDPIVISKDLLNSEDIRCFGGMDGTIVVTTAGGTPAFSYAWADASGNSLGSAASVTDVTSGEYFVTVTDANGCTGVDSLTLIDPPALFGDNEPIVPLDCFGDETSITVLDISGGSGGPYQFSVDFGVRLDTGSTIQVNGGEHFITYFDAQGCELTDTIDIAEPAQIVVSFDPPEVEIELGNQYQLIPNVSGAPVDSFIWSPKELLLGKGLVYEDIAYTFETQKYTLVVFDDKGCRGEGSIIVNIDPNRNVYVPNIFHAGNEGGTNDHFAPWIGAGVEKINFMRVYDRWGELMYSLEGFLPPDQPSFGWDGRYRGKFVNPGVYVYVIEVKFLDKRVLLYRGDVTVLR